MSDDINPGANAIGPASAALHARARAVFPGGVTRASVERDPIPRAMARGEGCWLHDLDGRRFLDLNGNFTTLIHGHGFPPVVAALQEQLTRGTCFANPTEHEVLLAETITARVPGLERIRFVNTGTEAVLFAIKAARALTGRPGIAKVEGAYHGAEDHTEVSQHSGPADWGSAANPTPSRTIAGCRRACSIRRWCCAGMTPRARTVC